MDGGGRRKGTKAREGRDIPELKPELDRRTSSFFKKMSLTAEK